MNSLLHKLSKTIIRAFFILLLAVIACNDSEELRPTQDCKNDIRAYEFGREMYTWVMIRAAKLTLEDAIREYQENVMEVPYNSEDECVKRGFKDAQEGKDSPYNLSGKNWSTF